MIRCKYIKREGESCTLNDNCKYPECPNIPETPFEPYLDKD